MKKFILLVAFSGLLFTSCATKVVAAPATENVVVVQKLPRKYRVVVVNGKKYYKWNGKHYQKTNRGYVRVRIRTI